MQTVNRGATALADPVFVLCAGRSGSTLLRFLLDSHPELACPPETRIPWLCTQMASAWSVIEDVSSDNSKNESGADGGEGGADGGAGGGGGGAGGGGGVPEVVLAGLRQSFGPMID